MTENKYKAKQIAISTGDGKTIDTIQLSKETLDGKYFPNPYYFYYDLQKGWTIKHNSFYVTISTDFNNPNTEERNVSPDYTYFSAAYLWNGSDSIGTINNNDNNKNMAIYGATNKQWLNISYPLYKDNYYNNNIRSIIGNYKSVNNGNQITSNGDSEIKIGTYNQCTKNLNGTYIISFKMSKQESINGNNNVLLTLDNYTYYGNTYDKIYLRYINGKGIELMVRNGKGSSNLLHNNVYAPFDETDRIYTILITPKINNSIKTTCVGFYYSNLLGSYNTVDQIETNNNFIITQSSGNSDFNIKIPALKDAINFESIYEAYFNGGFKYSDGTDASLFIDNGAYFKFIGDLMTPTTKVSKEPLQHFYNKGILNGITGNKINLWDHAATNTEPTNILNILKNIDGSGSGLDADTVDGKHASSFFDTTLTAINFTSATTQGRYTITTNPSDGPNPNDTSTIGWTCLVFYNDIIINGSKSITQIAINNTYNQLMYIRNNKDGTWGSWNCIATTYNLATMQFDATYGNKYNSISDIANEIANGTVNNSNKLNGLLASQYAGTNVEYITEFPTKSGIYYYKDENDKIIPGFAFKHYILIYGDANNNDDDKNTAIAINLKSGTILVYNYFLEKWFIISSPQDPNVLIENFNADLLDGYHANQLVKTEIATINVLPTETGIYNYVTSSIENKSIAYQLIVTKSVNDTCNYNYTAISPADNKIFVARALNVDSDTRPSVTWNEISSSSTIVSPTIPVVTEDPTSPTDGQMWIRSDLL